MGVVEGVVIVAIMVDMVVRGRLVVDWRLENEEGEVEGNELYFCGPTYQLELSYDLASSCMPILTAFKQVEILGVCRQHLPHRIAGSAVGTDTD